MLAPLLKKRHQLRETLGAGGTSTVYRVLDSVCGRDVALKVLHGPIASTSPALAAREYRLLASHSHPHIVRVLDFGTTPGGEAYFTMELCRGLDLVRYARERLPPPPALGDDPRLAVAVCQVLETLDYLHGQGVLHLDLKPANILVEDDHGQPCVKLIDFGLAQPAQAGGGDASGTVEYLAPERLRGESPEPRSDLYSLGVVLYEIFRGSPPFTAPTAAEVVRRHLDEVPRELEAIPPAYRTLVASLLEKRPEKRPRGAEAARALIAAGPWGTLPPYSPVLPFEAVFSGRRSLVERLVEHLTGFSTPSGDGGSRATIIVEGPTGAGKSRLLREAELEAVLRGTRVVRESAREGGDAAAGVIRRLLAQVAADEAPGSQLETDIASFLDSLGADPNTAGGGREPAGLESLRDGILYRATSLLVAAGRERPLALVVDDIEWADSLSLEALAYLSRRASSPGSSCVRLVLACRTDGAADAELLAGFRARLGAATPGFRSWETIELAPWSTDDVRGYLAQLLGGDDAFPAELPAELAAETGGLPALVEECLRLRAAEGGISRKGKRWAVAAGSTAAPRTLADAAARRVAGLDDGVRSLLEWVAVLGRPFRVGELEALAATPDLATSVSLMVRERLLRRDGDVYDVAHAALRRAVYSGIDPPRRQAHHGAVSRWLRSRPDSSPADELARHLFRSEDPRASRPYLLRAARAARLSGAVREAADALSNALEVSHDGDERAEVLLEREEVWGLLGLRQERLSDLRELESLSVASSAARQADLAMREAMVLDAAGEKRLAFDKLDAALARARGTGVVEARLLSRSGLLAFYLARFDDGRARLEQALALARQLADAPLEAECLQLIGVGGYLQGRYDDALVHLGRALVLRRELGDEARAGALESNIGLIQLDRGLLGAAEERFRGSLKAFRRSGIRRGEAISLVNLGLVYSGMGRFERSLDFIAEALAIRRELGDRHGEGSDLGNLGAVWLRIGRYERAAPFLEDAVRAARQAENRQSEVANLCRLGLLHLARGERDAARGRIEEASRVAAAAGGRSQELLVLTTSARLELSGGDATRALALAGDALAAATRGGMRSWVVESRSLGAEAALECGRLDAALAASAQATAELEEFPGWLESSQEVWFTRHRVLEAARRQGGADDEEASEAALRRAYTLLKEKADAFVDDDLRASFQSEIPLHREIARRHEELQRRIRSEASRRERSFYEIARSLCSVLELDPLLDRLLALAIETTHAEKGLISLANPDGGMTIRAARGMARESVEDAAEICRSVIADVTRGGEPVLATDAKSDDRFRGRQSIISFQIRTLMCAPLKVRDEVLGAVYVDGRGTASFTPEDLEYLVSFSRLAAMAVDNARLLGRLQAENLYLRKEVETRSRFESLIGRSPAMEQLAHLIDKVARSSACVLLSGETGTGKSLIARAIHYESERRSRPFVTVDCGALPENLLESELFGHRKGAFSGAIHDRVGLIEEAEGGTLFLDEISNTSPELQAKLLRVVQEGEIRRVGENQVRKVDVRVLAATNIDLRRAVDDGKFREDLYYRLNVIHVVVPPLRERRQDIAPLAVSFLKKACEREKKSIDGFTEQAMRLLEETEWKGNVRELDNTIEKAVILCDADRIDAAFLRELMPRPRGEAPPAAAEPHVPLPAQSASGELPAASAARAGATSLSAGSLEELDRVWLEAERAYLLAVVKEARWNLSAASRIAGVRNRNTLISRLKKHGIERPSDGDAV